MNFIIWSTQDELMDRRGLVQQQEMNLLKKIEMN